MKLKYFKSKKLYKMYEKRYIANIRLARELINIGANGISLKSENTLNTIIFSISYYYHIFKDKKALYTIEEIIRNNELPIKGKIYLYWQLVRKDFIDMKSNGYINLKKIYDDIENQIEEEKIITLPDNNENNKNENILVFTTNQFLFNDHSPTKVLLSIMKKINDNFNKIKKIYIFNTREMPYKSEYFFYNPMIANCIEYYNDDIFNELMLEEKIDRCEVYYNQFDDYDDVIKRIEEGVNEIYNLNPKYLISIGGSNIASDIYSKYNDSFTIGISSEVPIAKSKYLIKISNVKEIKEENIGNNQVLLDIPSSITDIEIKNNNGKEYSRKNMSIKDDMFLISIVGNRLKKELDKEFFNFCNKILKKNNNTGFIFIGPLEEKIINTNIEDSVRDKIYYINYAENLVSAMKLSDLYVNPLRLGGGLSALASIKLGIPVISHDIGDVALYLSSDFKVKNYNYMYIKVNEIIRSKGVYNMYLDKLNKLYLENSKSSWDMLLEYIFNNK